MSNERLIKKYFKFLKQHGFKSKSLFRNGDYYITYSKKKADFVIEISGELSLKSNYIPDPNHLDIDELLKKSVYMISIVIHHKYKRANINNYSGQLSRLQLFLQQNQLSVPNGLVDIIIHNNFYIPDLSQDINENLWDFCHSMCRFVVDKMPKNKEHLKNYLLTLKDNNESKCLCERVQALVDYSIDKIIKN